MSEILTCEDICLYYPGNPSFTLKDASLTVLEGEIVSLLGESGCGKTSLLNIAGGLIASSSGRAAFKGKTIRTTPIGISVVFQEACLLPWLTVSKNVGFGLAFKSLSVPKAEAKKRVEEALAEVGLSEQAGKYPATLSGGMAQRVALARSLALRSELSLLDEPFSSLDAITRRSMQELLLSLMRTHQSSALMVTHDIDEALCLSDRLILMRKDCFATSLEAWDLNAILGPAAAGPLPSPRKRSSVRFSELREEISSKLAGPQNSAQNSTQETPQETPQASSQQNPQESHAGRLPKIHTESPPASANMRPQ
jgi:NitT/TauT family transport system ATP-binding protein